MDDYTNGDHFTPNPPLTAEQLQQLRTEPLKFLINPIEITGNGRDDARFAPVPAMTADQLLQLHTELIEHAEVIPSSTKTALEGVNYPRYDQQTVVIDDNGLARPADVADDLAALDLADVRSVRDDAVNCDPYADDAERDLRIALLSLLAAEKDFADRGIPEFAAAAAGLRAQTAFLINTAHG